MRRLLLIIAALWAMQPLHSHSALIDCEAISSDETFKILVGSRGKIIDRRGMHAAISLKLRSVKTMLQRDETLARWLTPSIKWCENRWTDDNAAYGQAIVDRLKAYSVLLELHPHTEDDATTLHFAIVRLRHRTISDVPPLGFHETVYTDNEFAAVIRSTSELEAFVAIAYALEYENLAVTMSLPGLLNYAYDMYCLANSQLESARPDNADEGLLLEDWSKLRDFVEDATEALVQKATSGNEPALLPLRNLAELTGRTCVNS